MLCCTVAVLAQNPCTDACDKPVGCFKKRVNTHTLFVRDTAQICGDLTVKGQIHNLELDLLKNNAVPPTDEVYNEFLQFPYAQVILENIQDFFVPRELVVPGTEIYNDAPIYGYNEDQTLDLTGGPEKSYNPDFTGVSYKYHGQNPAELVLTTPDNMQTWYEHATSYYTQRGFPMPGIDVYPQYEGQFIFSNNLLGNDTFFPEGSGYFVAAKFVYDDESSLPTAVDFVATAAPALVSLDLYQPDSNLRQNGRYYPLRIPITTDINEFSEQYNKQPIAYFDNLHRTLTIHVSECDTTSHELSNFTLAIPCCTCNVDIDYTDNLVAFDGTFNLMRRNAQNQLVSSSFDQLEYLIQASNVVTVKTAFTDHGQTTIYEQDYNFSEPGSSFTGLAIPLMNGGSTSHDIYTFAADREAFSLEGDPLILPSLFEDGNILYQAGDNPVTPLVEHLGTPNYNGFWDTDEWFAVFSGLPRNVMAGETTPEENPEVPLPEPVESSRIFDIVVGHEMMHNTQFLDGSVFYFVPGEGQAVGVEQDVRLNNSVFSSDRLSAWPQYLNFIIRGEWPLTIPEINAPAATYGSSIFWKYMASQFDYNYQAMRRLNDILAHETLCPLLEANGIPFASAVLMSGTLGYNPTGSLLALDQALHEIHNKSVKDVFSDYAISLAMLRNNTSINEKYRHYYPYWLSSSTYPGYQELAAVSTGNAAWWQNYQQNISPSRLQLTTSPAIAGTPFTAFYTANGPRLSAPLAAQGEITDPSDACSTVMNDLTGEIGIVLRNGQCGSATIVRNTEAAGNPIAATLIIAYDADPSNFGGNPEQTQVAAVISAEDGDTLLAALEVNPTLTLILEPASFVPLLDQDVIDRQVEDMTMLIYQIPQGVNAVTVDVQEGEWRLSVLQFNSDGTPQGQFLIDGPYENNGGQTVFDISQFTGDGYIRLVAAHVSMHNYGGLSNWCQDAPILTGKISILRS